MKRVLASMVALLLLAWPAAAHEGHAHKVMGTVSMRHENHLEVMTAGGKKSTVTLNGKTKIVRGKAAQKIEDIRPGDRVVVTAVETKGRDGTVQMIASQVQLGTAGGARK